MQKWEKTFLASWIVLLSIWYSCCWLASSLWTLLASAPASLGILCAQSNSNKFDFILRFNLIYDANYSTRLLSFVHKREQQHITECSLVMASLQICIKTWNRVNIHIFHSVVLPSHFLGARKSSTSLHWLWPFLMWNLFKYLYATISNFQQRIKIRLQHTNICENVMMMKEISNRFLLRQHRKKKISIDSHTWSQLYTTGRQLSVEHGGN